MGDHTHPQPPPADPDEPVLLLPALPARLHAAPWLAQWSRTGEIELQGYQAWVVEQRVTDRHALLPVIVVLTGDKTDCISVERFELARSQSLTKEVRARLWDETRAVLKQSGARINETQQGSLPITALPSLPPSLSLVQIPGGDYRSVVFQLYQNINLRRLGLGGRSGLRLSNATPAQQLHFRQSYRLPMPPPSSTSPAPSPSPTSSGSPAPPPPFTQTLLSLISLVQHALSLFGLGPVKAFLSPGVLAGLPSSLTAATTAGGSASLLEILDRSLLEALSTPPSNSSISPSEAHVEDWADALGMPLSLFDPARDSKDALSRLGGAAAPLLEGDGLLCDTTVSALALFRVEYAARLLSSPPTSSAATAAHPTATSAAVGALARDEAVLSPGLLAALLSLAVGTRGKMLALGGGGAEGIPKDVFERRGRFLAAVGAFQKSHSAPSSLPPVLTPPFLLWLHTTYTTKFHPSSSSSLPNPLNTLRGGLSSLASTLPAIAHRGGGSSPASEGEGSDHNAGGGGGGGRAHPHLDRLLHGARGSRGEECETAELEAFVSGVLAGEGGGRVRGVGGRSARSVWGYGGGGGRDREKEEEREERRRGRRERRAMGRSQGGSTAAEEEPGAPGGSGGGVMPPTAAGGGAETLVAPTPATAAAAVMGDQEGTAPGGAGAGARNPVRFGKGVLKGVREKAGRARRRVGDGLGLGDYANEEVVRSADQGGNDQARLVAPQVVISPDSGDRSPASKPSKDDSKEGGESTASRAAALASRLASALSPPQVNLPTFGGGGAGHLSASSASLAASPAAHSQSSPRFPGALTLDTASASRRPSSTVSAGSRRTSAAHSPVSTRAGTPTSSRPPTLLDGGGAEGLGLGPPPGKRLAMGPRRTVSEMPPSLSSPAMGMAQDGIERLGEKEVRRSLLFGGEAVALDEEAREEGQDSDDEEQQEEDDAAEKIVFSPSPAARPPGPSPSRASSSRRPQPPPVRRRRHSITLPPQHLQAPEPWVFTSRRRMEMEVQLRWAAWELRGRERRLEEALRGLEAIHRSYTLALASLTPHVTSQTTQLTSLQTRASSLTARLESLTVSSTSPLSKLSTNTSRLLYAQAVLDDKLRDVLEFDRMLRAKVGPEGSLEMAARALAGERKGMRRLVRVLEQAVEWGWETGRRAGWWIGLGGAGGARGEGVQGT